MFVRVRPSYEAMRSLQALLFIATFSIGSAWASTSTTDVASALVIAKSSNKNEVHYAVHVDAACNPAAEAPVHPYWRMLERSNEATEPLSSLEQRAFGIINQEVGGDSVRFTLRGLPSRAITIRTEREVDGSCGAITTMPIAGAAARVSSIWVKQSLFGVSYVQLTGVDDRGKSVLEIVKP